MEKYKKLINNAKSRSATELVGHKEGPGARFVFADHTLIPTANIYAIVRRVINVSNPEPHVEPHRHNCESLWMILGYKPDLSGLKVEVTLGNEKYEVESPASIHIPAGLNHTYRFLNGSGHYINIVLAPGGKYNTATKK